MARFGSDAPRLAETAFGGAAASKRAPKRRRIVPAPVPTGPARTSGRERKRSQASLAAEASERHQREVDMGVDMEPAGSLYGSAKYGEIDRPRTPDGEEWPESDGNGAAPAAAAAAPAGTAAAPAGAAAAAAGSSAAPPGAAAAAAPAQQGRRFCESNHVFAPGREWVDTCAAEAEALNQRLGKGSGASSGRHTTTMLHVTNTRGKEKIFAGRGVLPAAELDSWASRSSRYARGAWGDGGDGASPHVHCLACLSFFCR